MKKVVLLGDSIRMIGYGTKVPELLGEGYEVFQPKENCRFVKYTLRMLHDLRNEIAGADVIHWNNGLWDLCRLFDDGEPMTSEAEYVENMLRVAKLWLAMTPNVIFATTTPVRKEKEYNDNETAARYNAAVVPKLEALGIRINDLYSALIGDVPRYIREDDKIHLTEEGIDVCATKVVEAIKQFD